jgi:hypothetical protein
MSKRVRIWLLVAVLFAVGNLLGAGFAAVSREPLHATVHLALTLVGAFVAWQLARARAQAPAPSGALDARMAQLELSVESVAVEIERIGEGQRFVTRLLTEDAPADPGAQAPIAVGTREVAPLRRG